ncbi:unnamed protein product, partial [Dicrocoelium dendriticum]
MTLVILILTVLFFAVPQSSGRPEKFNTTFIRPIASFNPVILGDQINTNIVSLTEALKNPQSEDLDAVVQGKVGPPVNADEGEYTIDYIAFLGFPKGETTVWTLSQWEQSVIISDCTSLFKKPIEHEGGLPYVQNRMDYLMFGSWNYEVTTYTCVLDIHTVGLAIVVYIPETSTGNEESTEVQLKRVFIKSFEARLATTIRETKHGVDGYTSTWQNTIHTQRIALLHILGCTNVTIGKTAEMIGHRPPKNVTLRCFFKSDQTSAYVPAPDRFIYDKEENGGSALVFRLVNTQYTDTGFYKCNISEYCEQCKPTAGLPPRHLLVLPEKDNVQIHLSMQPFPENMTSFESFSQVAPHIGQYIKPNQAVYVLCTADLIPYGRMELTCEAHDYHLHKYIPWSVRVLKDWSVKGRNGSQKMYSYLLQAPEASATIDALILNCNLTYYLESVPTHSLLPSETLQQVAVVTVKMHHDVAAQLFPLHVRSSLPELLSNWKPVSSPRDSMSAVQFHQSAPSRRLEEAIVYIHRLDSLGMPNGRTKTLALFKTGFKLEFDECILTQTTNIDATEVPADVQRTRTFHESGGRGFVNVTFLCTLQPQHVALIFVVYNVELGLKQPDDLPPDVSAGISANVLQWLVNSSDPTPLQWPKLSGLRGSYEAIKL